MPSRDLSGASHSTLYIEEFTEMLREVLRALAATDNSAALSNASRRLRNLVADSEQLPPELSWYAILDAAIDRLKPAQIPFDSPDAYNHEYDGLARYGVKLLAERTTHDGFSAARIAKSNRAMADEIKSISELRKLRRELRSGLPPQPI